MTFVSDIDCGSGLRQWAMSSAAPWHPGEHQAPVTRSQVANGKSVTLLPLNRGAPFRVELYKHRRKVYTHTKDLVQTYKHKTRNPSGTLSCPIDGAWQSLHLVILTSLPPSWQIGYLLAHIIDSNEYWTIFKYVHQQHITLFRFGESCVFVFLMFSFKNKHNIHKWDKNNIWQC